MKKLLLFCLPILFISLSWTPRLHSQPPPQYCFHTIDNGCNGTCDTTAWIDSYQPIYADTNGCRFMVSYKWKQCIVSGQIIREVSITNIDMIQGGTCGVTDLSTIINKAVIAVLSRVYEIFMLDPSVSPVITISIPSCIHKASPCINNVQCNSGCCSSNISLTQVNHEVQATGQTPPSIAPPCSIDNNCHNYCSSLTVPHNQSLYPFSSAFIGDCNNLCNNPSTYKVLFRSTTLPTMTIWFAETGACGDSVLHSFTVYEIDVTNPNGLGDYEMVRIAYQAVYRMYCKEVYNVAPIAGNYIRTFVHPCWTHWGPDSVFSLVTCPVPNNCCYRDVRLNWLLDTIQPLWPGPAHVNPYYGDTIDCNGSDGCANYCNVVFEFAHQEHYALYPKMIDYNNPPPEKKEETVLVEDTISIKPNPVENNINFSIFSTETGPMELKIYSSFGSQVYQQNLEKSGKSIALDLDVGALVSGSYYCVVRINNKILNGKFIILK